MKRIGLWAALASVYCLPSALMAAVNFGVGYRENWDAYAPGRTDATYNAVWSCYVVAPGTTGNPTYTLTTDTNNYPNIQTSSAISASRNIVWEGKNRTLVNSLTDGISNVGIGGAGTELSAGQVLKPDPTVPLNDTRSATNYDNLQLRDYFGYTVGSQRAQSGQFAEMSFGNIHAPSLIGGLVPLTTAIPVIGLGKLPAPTTATFTNGSGGGPGGTNIYFFDGKQWNSLGALASVNGTEGVVAKIFYDSGLSKWRARVDYIFGTTSLGSPATFDLQFDPTVLGFDTVSWNMVNSGTNPTGTPPFYDDVWIAGGLVVPEPTTIGLLAMGGLMLTRRRRMGS